MTRKSQAALEFLTTYAWAFLVILIMIGALAYFGILNPSKILPDRCTFGAEIRCVDYRIGFGTTGADGTLNLRLKNNVGEPIVISAVESDVVISTESVTAYSCSSRNFAGLSTGSFTWKTDETIEASFSGCNPQAVGFSKKDKGKIFVTINYNLAKTSSVYKRQVNGEVFATVN